jgi:hypothetical protein
LQGFAPLGHLVVFGLEIFGLLAGEGKLLYAVEVGGLFALGGLQDLLEILLQGLDASQLDRVLLLV